MKKFLGIVVGLITVASLVAQSHEYGGKLTAIEKTRIQIERDQGLKPRQIWLGVTDETPVIDGETTTTLAAAKLKRNAIVTASVVPFEGPAPKEWSCAMHTHIAEAGPGKCPVCGMALTSRDKVPSVREIRVTKR